MQPAVIMFVLFFMSIFSGGCATIIHGTKQEVIFNTNPPGATLRFENGMTYTTPATIKLERKKDYVVHVSKDGYASQTIPLNSVLSGWLAGNLLLGGIIGGGVDLVSGAAWRLTPEHLMLTLQLLAPGQVAEPPPTEPVSIEEKLRAIERMHQDGVLKDNEYEASKKKLLDQLTQS